MKNAVFIHTNAKQIVGAQVAAYSLKRNSKRPHGIKLVKTRLACALDYHPVHRPAPDLLQW